MIPKILHQIWINPNSPELPDKFQVYRDGWLALHSDWQYKLWNLDNLDFTPSRMDLIKSAPNFAQMSDILRYEILFRYGGVYIDIDFECLKNIDSILKDVKNFACSEDGYHITNAIIGAEPNSVYMERCINALPKRVGIEATSVETGPYLFTRVLLSQGLASDFILFPQEWFYPYHCSELHRANENFPQAYAVHRWAGSWTEENHLFNRARRKVLSLLRRFGII
jgi:inositol phosphorylceramide mannosyltransferase catalytic subunit